MRRAYTVPIAMLIIPLAACGGSGGTAYVPCTKDADCRSEEVCLAGSCAPGQTCAVDSDCQGGRVCLSGVCRTGECVADQDCASGLECKEHRCTEKTCICVTDADCGPNATCADGCRCTPKQSCTDDQGCPQGTLCLSGFCNPPPVCNGDTDCPEQTVCEGGLCKRSCAQEADCAAGQICNAGHCVPKCTGDADCATGELCLDDLCTPAPACADDAACPTDTVCEKGKCARPCAADADCSNQLQGCRNGHCFLKCLSDATCINSTICESGLCVPPLCASDTDCAGELVRCLGGRCEPYTPCATDGDCDPNFVCLENICEERPTCSIDQNCIDQGLVDTICIDSHCRPVQTCSAEADCPAEADCIGGHCLTHLCRGSVDCAQNLHCVGGACVPPDDVDTIYEVVILNAAGPIRQGQEVLLTALARTQSGQVVSGATFTWESGAPARVAVASPGLIRGGSEAGSATVQASTENSQGTKIRSAPVTFENTLTLEDALRVTVIRSIDRQGVSAAIVRVVASDGSLVDATTDAAGVAVFPSLKAPPFDIHVFSATHNTVSVLQTSSADVLVGLNPKSDQNRVGGFTGQMAFKGSGALGLGIAGASIAGNLFDMDFTNLMGQAFNIPIQQLGKIPVPAQVVMELAVLGQTYRLKTTYYVLGQTGLRTAWGMGGRLAAKALWDLAGGGATSAQEILLDLIPYYSLLLHGVRPIVDIFPYSLVTDTDDIDQDGDTTESRPNWGAMTDLDLTPSTPQNMNLFVTAPDLPTHAGAALQTVLVLAGASTPLGFTTLGLSAMDTTEGVVTPRLMKMAPAYGGLENGDYTVIVLGVPAAQGSAMPTDITALVDHHASLPTDQVFGAGFLAFTEDAAWASAARTLTATPVPGATLYRSSFRMADGIWEVFAPAPAPGSPVAFTLPSPPAGMLDLSPGAIIALTAVALKSPLDYEGLVTFDGQDLDQLHRLTRGFSRQQVQ